MNDDHTIGDALRRELHDISVPYDPGRAEEMIAAATATDPRRLSRLAAPLATAAAVLAVGAGVAVFAATGGSDSAMPGGGAATPRPTATSTSAPGYGYGSVECLSVRRHLPDLTVAPGQKQSVTCPSDSAPPVPPPPVTCRAIGATSNRPRPRRLKSPPRCAFSIGPDHNVPVGVPPAPSSRAYVPPPPPPSRAGTAMPSR